MKLAVLMQFALLFSAVAVPWQWAVDTGVKNTGKAFLWVPSECRQVRGVIVGQQVILEKLVFEDPQIRAAAGRQDLAIVFIVPAAIGYDEFGPEGKGAATFRGIMDGLAAVSGYDEIARVPFLALGHSGGAIFAWRAGYWRPDRCLGIVGLHAAPSLPPAHKGQETVDGVPVLVITGQYESWGNTALGIEHHIRWVRGELLAFRGRWERPLVSELVQPGVSHFNWDDRIAAYVAMFIEKAAAARLPEIPPPAGEAPVLRRIPPASGWLTDCTLLNPPRYPAAPAETYTGDPTLAFWHLDEQLARENEAYAHSQDDRALQLLTFLQNGKPLAPAWLQKLTFSPLADGMTMQVHADFVTEPPAEFLGVNAPLGHADGPIRFRLVGGWAGGGEQVGPDTFRIRFDRFGMARNSGGLMVMAWHPGDATYACTEQPISLDFPAHNTAGQPQTITFAPIPDQTVGAAPLRLSASSSAGLPVEFCVIAGPAEVAGDTLTLLPAPPRARFPVAVTVAAWQWGRCREPLVRTADPILQTFHINRRRQY